MGFCFEMEKQVLMIRQRAVWLLLMIGTVMSGIAESTAYPVLKTYPTRCQALAYEEYGTGKPIVLLGGGPGMNPNYMAPVAKLLSSAGHRVLLLDQRGTGRSSDAIACRERMNLAGAIADLEAFRVHLEMDKLTIAGHSFGGMLAMAYAQQHPDHVAGLLLLDTGPMRHTDFPTESIAVRARLTKAEEIALHNAKSDAQIDAIELPAYFADPGNANLLKESIPASEPLDYELVDELLGPDLRSFDVVDGMRKLTAPIALVFGRLDPGFFVSGEIQKLQPKAKLFVVKGAGHYPWLENQSKTAMALRAAAALLP
jgi:proline iminopeptidase